MSNTESSVILLARGEVERRCSISRSEIYRRMRIGTFPQVVRVGGSVRWRSDDIDAWIESLPRDAAPAAI